MKLKNILDELTRTTLVSGGQNREMIVKGVKVRQLFSEVIFPPQLEQFFNLDSDELLDEKIEVLTALKEGKSISEISKFYDILELCCIFSFTQKTASQLFSIRICRRIFFSIRDTCTCEIPSFPAICACVMS